MLKIGDFSKICQVSIKSLRHWDSIGLLKPALIDPQSSYRYYSIDQVELVNRILAFRAMDLALPQIVQLLHERPSAEDIRAMLRLKQVELQQQIDNAAAMLTVVESRLQQIELGGGLPDYEVTLKAVEAQPILAIRETMADFNDLVQLLEAAYPYARQRTGTSLLAVFHDEGYETETIDIEVGFPVDSLTYKPISLSARHELRPTILPSVELVACTIHKGEWLTLSRGYAQLGRWIDVNGYAIVGAGREIFHHIDWENAQKSTVTELQFPVVKRSP